MLDKSIKEINELLKQGTIKPIDLVEEAFSRIEEDKDLNAYITLNKEEALKIAKELGIEMPICEMVNRLLFEGISLNDAMIKLLSRPYKESLFLHKAPFRSQRSCSHNSYQD